MADQKKDSFKLEVGQVVDVTLESMVGSTGYGWELASLEGSVHLCSISVIPTKPGIAPVAHVFSFRGVAEGKGTAVFVLTAAWKIEEPKKTVTYEFEVVKVIEGRDDSLQLKGFTTAPAAQIRGTAPQNQDNTCCGQNFDPRMYYGVFPPYGMYPSQCGFDPTILYAVRPPQSDSRLYYGILPPQQPDPRLYYGMLPPQASNNDVRSYYGILPQQAANDWCNPPSTMKYNYPAMKYNFIGMRYNYPDSDGCCC